MKALRFLFAGIIGLLVFSFQAAAAEASPAGAWKWSIARANGPSSEQTLKLDYKDGKLTGVLLGSKGGRFQFPDTPIADASFHGGTVKFSVTREADGVKSTTNYAGKLEGDVMTGFREYKNIQTGELVKREWVAQRAK